MDGELEAHGVACERICLLIFQQTGATKVAYANLSEGPFCLFFPPCKMS